MSRAAFILALQRGVLMARGPASVYAAQALTDYDKARLVQGAKRAKTGASERPLSRARKPYALKQKIPAGVAPTAYTLDHKHDQDAMRR